MQSISKNECNQSHASLVDCLGRFPLPLQDRACDKTASGSNYLEDGVDAQDLGLEVVGTKIYYGRM